MQRAKTLKFKSSHSKPFLTEANTKNRVKHALSFLRSSSNGTIFDNMNSYVHVDEKWFFLTTVKKSFYAYDDEELPKRQLKSKQSADVAPSIKNESVTPSRRSSAQASIGTRDTMQSADPVLPQTTVGMVA
ncbi:hypothetical protein H257_15457 [Aphanomyces astaci]|uniref:Uncharacterized protein n=1 Tax=Aphanomyces astaci TaxID=112090 RepID=W4FNZ2_APHAT|nr:hypothetical protein H257_15457 [Aphanomyces astaci]ETV68651.1 hypothetical protein H257_15457 [Aphanomyces astaci]|eukprot:XP_009841876.1 hypothetical protein H257_15457 [Aphanomyces astaci]